MNTSPSNFRFGLGCDAAGCGFCLHTQDIPCDVGTEVFAAHKTARGPLDQWAALSRDAALSGLPLAQKRGGDAQFFGHASLRSRLGSEVVSEVHDRIISAALKPVNSDTRIYSVSKGLNNQSMRIEEIYRVRLKMLAAESGSQTALASKIEKSPAQISQWINDSKDSKTGKPRSMDRTTAREIERKCGKPDGWMDQPIDDAGYNASDFTPVRRADVAFSNGSGHVVYHERRTGGYHCH